MPGLVALEDIADPGEFSVVNRFNLPVDVDAPEVALRTAEEAGGESRICQERDARRLVTQVGQRSVTTRTPEHRLGIAHEAGNDQTVCLVPDTDTRRASPRDAADVELSTETAGVRALADLPDEFVGPDARLREWRHVVHGTIRAFRDIPDVMAVGTAEVVHLVFW